MYAKRNLSQIVIWRLTGDVLSCSFIEENNEFKLAQKEAQRNQRMPPGAASQDMMAFWGMLVDPISTGASLCINFIQATNLKPFLLSQRRGMLHLVNSLSLVRNISSIIKPNIVQSSGLE